MKAQFEIDKDKTESANVSEAFAIETGKWQLLSDNLDSIFDSVIPCKTECFNEDVVRYEIEFCLLNAKDVLEIKQMLHDIKEFKPSHEIEWRLKEIFKMISK